MNLTRTVAPTLEPITLDEVRAQAVVTFTDDNELLESLIKAAIARLDGYSGILGRCLINQEWSFQVESWAQTINLPFPDVSEVVVKYLDADDVEQTVPAADYVLLRMPGSSHVRFMGSFGYPSLQSDNPAPITVTLTAGYGAAADDVPSTIRHALLLLVSHWYEHREAVGAQKMYDIPMGVDALLTPHRVAFLR